MLTVWIVADLETEQGREALLSAVSHVKTSSLMRVGIIHNAAKVGTVTKIVQAALQTFDPKAAKLLLLKVLKEDTVRRLESGKKKLTDYDIPGADMKALEGLVADEGSNPAVFEIHSTFCKTALGMRPGQSAVVVNGRLIGPLDDGERFGADDFNLLEKFTMAQYGEKMVNLYYSHMDVKGTAKVTRSDFLFATVDDSSSYFPPGERPGHEDGGAADDAAGHQEPQQDRLPRGEAQRDRGGAADAGAAVLRGHRRHRAGHRRCAEDRARPPRPPAGRQRQDQVWVDQWSWTMWIRYKLASL